MATTGRGPARHRLRIRSELEPRGVGGDRSSDPRSWHRTAAASSARAIVRAWPACVPPHDAGGGAEAQRFDSRCRSVAVDACTPCPCGAERSSDITTVPLCRRNLSVSPDANFRPLCLSCGRLGRPSPRLGRVMLPGDRSVDACQPERRHRRWSSTGPSATARCTPCRVGALNAAIGAANRLDLMDRPGAGGASRRAQQRPPSLRVRGCGADLLDGDCSRMSSN